MYTETRKISLIEAVLKENNEATLIEIETVLKKSKSKIAKQPFSVYDLSGAWSKRDAVLIEKAIEEGCEQIHQDDWK